MEPRFGVAAFTLPTLFAPDLELRLLGLEWYWLAWAEVVLGLTLLFGIYVLFFAILLIIMTLLGAGLPGLASGLQHGTDRRCFVAYCCSAAYSVNLTRSLPIWRYVQSILESDSMNTALQRPFFRQIERWLVSLVMAAMAYVIEKALLGSIRRGEAKPRPHAQSSAETIFSAGAERRRSAQR
jgi:hypothetical protein